MPCVRPDRVTALDDTVLNVRIVSEIHIIEDDGIFDHTVISDKDFLEDHRILNRAVDDAPAPHKAVR